MQSILSDHGILIIYFAHKNLKSWDFILNTLMKDNFRITATWPIHTENPKNPLLKDNASLESHIIIVARKRPGNEKISMEEKREDFKIHLNKRIAEFWENGLR